jgi:hypothetical protein
MLFVRSGFFRFSLYRIGSSALAERAHLAVESETGKSRRRTVLARSRGKRGGAESPKQVRLGLEGADDARCRVMTSQIPPTPLSIFSFDLVGRSCRLVRIGICNSLSSYFHQARVGQSTRL